MNGAGHPVRLIHTPGRRGDATQAQALLAGVRRGRTRRVIADRGYDADAVLARVRRRLYRRRLHRGKDVVERFRARVKHRRAATRCDKLDVTHLAFVHLAALVAVLRD